MRVGTEDVVAACLWQRLKGTGLERFELARDAGAWLLRGTLLVLDAATTAEARYEVRCDQNWRTTAARVWVRDDAGGRTLELTANGGRWLAFGREMDAV